MSSLIILVFTFQTTLKAKEKDNTELIPIHTLDKLIDYETKEKSFYFRFSNKEKTSEICDVSSIQPVKLDVIDIKEQIETVNKDILEIQKVEEKRKKEEEIKFTFHFPAEQRKYSSYFGYRENPFGTGGYEFHTGVDIYGKGKIFSVLDGTVIASGYDSMGYGYYVDVEHPYYNEKIITRYAHLKNLIVERGQEVKKGEQIGIMGTTGRSTGVHLHFELIKDNKRIDPYPLLEKGK